MTWTGQDTSPDRPGTGERPSWRTATAVWHIILALAAASVPAAEAKKAATRPRSAASGAVSISQLRILRKTYVQNRRTARDLLRAADATKDRDAAGKLKVAAKEARVDADAAQRRFETVLKRVVSALAKDLDDDSYGTRERATTRLLQLGPCAKSLLAKILAGKNSPEVHQRVTHILAKLGELSDDEDGRLHQWAGDAKASSEYSNPGWSARQSTGKPDTMQGGDIQTAWATKRPDDGTEWLELTYREAVHPTLVRVRETYNPGAVTKVEARDTTGRWHTLWEGKDATKACPGWLETPIARPTWTCRVIKVTLNTAAVRGWNEIDAVELVGELPE